MLVSYQDSIGAEVGPSTELQSVENYDIKQRRDACKTTIIGMLAAVLCLVFSTLVWASDVRRKRGRSCHFN
jgi:hypothetical protein